MDMLLLVIDQFNVSTAYYEGAYLYADDLQGIRNV